MSTASNSLWTREQARSGTDGMSAKEEKLKNEVVRDDWEDDDEEEEADNPVAVGERNKQIWNEANSRQSRPMPSVIISRGSSIQNTSSNLPLNQPPAMRILKRPSPSTNVPSNTNAIEESLQDREARYVAARERIFGTSTSEDQPTEEMGLQHFGEKLSLSSSTIPSQVIRELRGPTLGDGTNSSSIKGFVHRRAERSKNTILLPSEDTSL